MEAISHQSVYLAQSGTAIDPARTGQVAARRTGLPTLLRVQPGLTSSSGAWHLNHVVVARLRHMRVWYVSTK
jgi:hypothetical protein